MNPNVLTTERLEDVLGDVKERFPIATTKQVKDILDNVFGTDTTPPKDGVFEHLYSQLRNLMPNTNILDNWYLKDPINQRGQLSYTIQTSGTYIIDRWIGSRGQFDITDDGLKITPTIESTGSAWVGQRIDRPSNLIGRTVTISALSIEDGLIAATGIFPDKDEPEIEVYSESGNTRIRLEFLDGQEYPMFQLWSMNSVSITYVAAKVEIGNKQTLSYQNDDGEWILNDYYDYQHELMKCLQYQMIFASTSTSHANLGTTIAFPNNTAVCVISSLPMRERPELTADVSNMMVSNGTYAYFVDSVSISPVVDATNHISLSIVMRSNGTVTVGMGFNLSVRNGGSVILDANL